MGFIPTTAILCFEFYNVKQAALTIKNNLQTEKLFTIIEKLKNQKPLPIKHKHIKLNQSLFMLCDYYKFEQKMMPTY